MLILVQEKYIVPFIITNLYLTETRSFECEFADISSAVRLLLSVKGITIKFQAVINK